MEVLKLYYTATEILKNRGKKEMLSDYKKPSQQQAEIEKEIKEIQKKQGNQDNFKQYEKDLHIAIESDLKQYFYNYLDSKGLNIGLNELYLKETRENIIKGLGQDDFSLYFLF